jgi:DNA-binding IclR family transcriptional regulator
LTPANRFDGGGTMENLVKSSVRSIEVIEFFHRRGTPARAIEIGGELGLAPSTTNDLLKTLVEVGYLEFDPSKKTYFLGLRSALFGQWASRMLPDAGRAGDLADDLRQQTGESIVLAAQNGHTIQFLRILHGPDGTPGNVAEGLNAPMIGTAAGGAILMRKGLSELTSIVQRTYRLKSSAKALDSTVKTISFFNERGYASIVQESLMPGYWALALPLPTRARTASMSLGIGGAKERIQSSANELAKFAQSNIERYFH